MRKFAKTYIDVPVVAYKTWAIWYSEEVAEDEDIDDRGVRELEKMFPYSDEHDHVR